MKIKLFTLIYLFFFFAGCQLGEKQGSGMSDAELVQLIIAAQKEQISVSELPAKSILYLESDIEYDEIETHIALELGYEVKRIGNGSRIGHRNEVYFNLEGRKLDPTNWSGERQDREIYGEYSAEKDRDDWRCFYMVFPVTFVMPDGSTITVSSDDESGWSELKSWYESNDAYDSRPSIQYPIDIVFDSEEGEISETIHNDEDMDLALEECKEALYENRDWIEKECYKLVFPVTFVMPDGSTITVASDDESGWSELKSWYESNESEEEPSLQYPVEIIRDTEQGEETIVINSEEELAEVKETCRDYFEDSDDSQECFEYLYPIIFVMPDGSTITVASDDESGWSELKSWYESNESEEEPSLQYPVEIIRDTEQGEETIVINSEEELAEVKETCRDYFEDSDDSEECFEYLYPITFVMPDGSTITVQNEDGLLILHRWYEENSGYEEEPVLQYPVSVVLETEEGETTLVVNSETEIDMIYENCELDE